MRLILFLTSLILSCSVGYARVNFRRLTTFQVSINSPDSSQKACVLESHGKINPNQVAFYYWFGNNSIHSTQGGFSGRLLHGTYTASYPNQNLKSQGCFDHGLKTGKWITWYSSGRIREIIYYSHGLQHGRYEIYDSSGNLTTLIYFRNGVKHGKAIYYHEGKIDSTVCYKRGIVVPMKECRDSIGRTSIIKRKSIDSVSEERKRKNDSAHKFKVKKDKRFGRDTLNVKHREADTTKSRFRKLFQPRKKTN